MWIALTESHIQTGLTGGELSAALTKALADDQVSPLEDVIAQTVRYVRSRVAACSHNSLGPAGTIPDELLAQAIDIAVLRLAKRIPGKILAKQERIDAATAAEAVLRDVAACKVALEQPPVPSEEITSSGAGEVVSKRRPTATRETMDGL